MKRTKIKKLRQICLDYIKSIEAVNEKILGNVFEMLTKTQNPNGYFYIDI